MEMKCPSCSKYTNNISPTSEPINMSGVDHWLSDVICLTTFNNIYISGMKCSRLLLLWVSTCAHREFNYLHAHCNRVPSTQAHEKPRYLKQNSSEQSLWNRLNLLTKHCIQSELFQHSLSVRHPRRKLLANHPWCVCNIPLYSHLHFPLSKTLGGRATWRSPSFACNCFGGSINLTLQILGTWPTTLRLTLAKLLALFNPHADPVDLNEYPGRYLQTYFHIYLLDSRFQVPALSDTRPSRVKALLQSYHTSCFKIQSQNGPRINFSHERVVIHPDKTTSK